MKETIGKVVLDYSKYPGEDFYSEGISEDALLEVVENQDASEYDRVILGTRSWPMLYHLSHIRGNVISWLPIQKSHTVLEIGAGCGAVTGTIADMAKKVTCIELSKKRSLINATRNRHRNNIEILVGNFEDIEKDLEGKYDFITLIGVFEYAKSYIHDKNPYETFLQIVGKHLAPGGKIVMAIENQFGLKYFAGCKEDHTGRYYEGIEGYTNSEGVRTFSKKKLEQMFVQAGFHQEFYYPYPDYKFAHTIYSDEKLPKEGDLTTNKRNFDADRVIVFDESKAFDQVIREGMFPHYANSFIAILSYDDIVWDERTIYAKYSSERRDIYSIMTYITCRDGKRHIYKAALTPLANAHITGMEKKCERLLQNYQNTVFTPNRISCVIKGEAEELIAGRPSTSRDRIELEYLEGVDFDKHLNLLQEDEAYDKILHEIDMFVEEIGKTQTSQQFQVTAEYEEIFGRWQLGKEYAASQMCNFDMIFSNILLTKQDEEKEVWNVLDYEWTFDFQIPLKYVIYRSLFYYLRSDASRLFRIYLAEQKMDLYERYGMTQTECQAFDKMERHFQVYLIGDKASLTLLHTIMPSSTVDMSLMVESGSYLRNLQTPKVYFSMGEGFSEDNKIAVLAGVDERAVVTLEFKLENRMRAIRIDPTEYPCVIQVKRISVMTDAGEKEISRYLINGVRVSDTTVIFDTSDGQIVIENVPLRAKSMRVEYMVTMFREEFFTEVTEALGFNRGKNKKERKSLLDRVLIKCGMTDRKYEMNGYCYNRERE